MTKFYIHWQDLNEQAQQRLLNVFGDNHNWDCIPMAILEVDNEKDIVLDSFPGDKMD